MLDGASEQPLYLQLVDQLEMEIRNSMLANDKLSSERDDRRRAGQYNRAGGRYFSLGHGTGQPDIAAVPGGKNHLRLTKCHD